MKSYLRLLWVLGLLAISTCAQTVTDWSVIDRSLGRAGQLQPDGAYKVSLPRRDLKVVADGVELKPGFALGAWLAFRRVHDGVEVMGDLVLTEDEVTPVMRSLAKSGIQVNGLHNHLKGDSPKVLYMHVEGMGSAEKLGSALREALALTKTPAPAPAATAPELSFDTKKLDQVMGRAGKNNGGVYQYSIPRAEKIMQDGEVVPNSMGLATALNFQPLNTGQAAITGDFVLVANEVNPVIRALHVHGIEVTALHSHMLREEPRLFFMHFWATGEAVKLAEGLAAALKETNSQPRVAP